MIVDECHSGLFELLLASLRRLRPVHTSLELLPGYQQLCTLRRREPETWHRLLDSLAQSALDHPAAKNAGHRVYTADRGQFADAHIDERRRYLLENLHRATNAFVFITKWNGVQPHKYNFAALDSQ
jgi:hypothetical protein